MGMMKRSVLVLFVLLVGGAFAVATAEHKGGGAQTPEKIVQGVLKEIDPLNHTITMDMGVLADRENPESQMVMLKVGNEAFEQIHRTAKKGERLELRLSGDDVVQSVAVGTGP